VLDRLRAFLNRPLEDAERARLFLVAVVAIALGAVALALMDDPGTGQPGPASGRPAASSATAEPVASLELPSEEGEPPAAAESTRADVEAARTVARRFLAGYLPFSYGQAGTHAIEDASDELRRRLAAEPPRVPVSERRRRPRVLLVQANGVGEVRAAVVALIADGARRYTVPVELERRSSGWIVTSAGG
jgi:hypothetical protein